MVAEVSFVVRFGEPEMRKLVIVAGTAIAALVSASFSLWPGAPAGTSPTASISTFELTLAASREMPFAEVGPTH